MKKINYLLIVPICLFVLKTNAQIVTSEVKVEQTGDYTTISGPLEVKAPYNGTSQLIVNSTSSSGELRFSENGSAKGFVWYSPSNNLMAFGRGNWTNSLTVTSDGKFGFGTSAPKGQLEIKGPYNGNSQLIINTTSSNGELRFSENGSVKGFVWYSPSNDLMAFGRGSTPNSLFATSDGKFGVGITNPSEKLHVNGNIRATAPIWADFVFESEYKLRTLEEVEQHINEKGHLPGIPSEAEVTENGINLGEMDAKLLQKIEELTLYLIEQNKEIKELRQEVSALKNE